MNQRITRDEREAAIDHAADRLGYLVLSFGLLVIVAWRSFANHESSWDLLLLVVLGGAVATAYRVSRHVATRSWWLVAGLSIGLALVLAAIMALALR